MEPNGSAYLVNQRRDLKKERLDLHSLISSLKRGDYKDKSTGWIAFCTLLRLRVSGFRFSFRRKILL